MMQQNCKKEIEDNLPDIKGPASQPNVTKFSNEISKDRMLLVLSTPSVHDKYYKPAFQNIVDFQINYAKSIMGHDNVVIIVDKDTKEYYDEELPDDVLITVDVYDIWMRDFTTVNPLDPVQFKYTSASMTKRQSKDVQKSFAAFADEYNIERDKSDLIIDGGNIVDNPAAKIRYADENSQKVTTYYA